MTPLGLIDHFRQRRRSHVISAVFVMISIATVTVIASVLAINNLSSDVVTLVETRSEWQSDTELHALVDSAKWEGILWSVIAGLTLGITGAATAVMGSLVIDVFMWAFQKLEWRYSRRLAIWELEVDKKWKTRFEVLLASFYATTLLAVILAIVLAWRSDKSTESIASWLSVSVGVLVVPAGIAFAGVVVIAWQRSGLPRDMFNVAARWFALEGTFTFVVIVCILPPLAVVGAVIALGLVRFWVIPIFGPWEDVIIHMNDLVSGSPLAPGSLKASLQSGVEDSNVSIGLVYEIIGGHSTLILTGVFFLALVVLVPTCYLAFETRSGGVRRFASGKSITILIFIGSNLFGWLLAETIPVAWKIIASLLAGLLLWASFRYMNIIFGQTPWICSNPDCLTNNMWTTEYCGRCGWQKLRVRRSSG